jgi:hypothetical protein
MNDHKTKAEPITTGSLVLTRDGAELGKVKNVSARSFKVDAPMQKDYWLARDLVTSSDDVAVILDVPASSISEHRADTPDLSPGEDPFEFIQAKPAITNEELLDQRARMERELAEQSRSLPPHELSPTEVRGPRGFERIPADHTGFNDLAGEYVPNAPVQDRLEAELHPQSGSTMRRALMFGFPLAIGAAAVAGIMLFRRRRNTANATTADVRKQFQHSAQVAGAEARQCASSVARAAKPVAQSLSTQAKDRTRRLVHNGLSAAAKQFA